MVLLGHRVDPGFASSKYERPVLPTTLRMEDDNDQHPAAIRDTRTAGSKVVLPVRIAYPPRAAATACDVGITLRYRPPADNPCRGRLLHCVEWSSTFHKKIHLRGANYLRGAITLRSSGDRARGFDPRRRRFESCRGDMPRAFGTRCRWCAGAQTEVTSLER